MGSSRQQSSWKVLIIDDDRKVSENLKLILCPPKRPYAEIQLAQLVRDQDLSSDYGMVRSPSFQCDIALSGVSGLEKVVAASRSRSPYAVVTIDMRMPGGWDGLKTASQIRAVDSQIHIIFVTSWSDYSLEDIQQRIGYKFNFLSKPVRHNEFLQMVISSAYAWSDSRQVVADAKHLEEYHQHVTESLTLEKEHIELVFEAMNEAVVMVDRVGNIEGVNTKLSKMTGWIEEEIAGHPFSTVFVEHEQRIDRRKGLRAEVSQLNAELLELLQHSLERWVDASLLAVMRISVKGAILQSNYAMETLSGWCSEDLVGGTLEPMLPEEMRGHHGRLVEQFINAPEIRRMGGERILPLVCHDGSIKPVEIALVPLKYRGEEIVLAVLHDPTEQQKLDLFRITPFGSLFVQRSIEDGVEVDWELKCKEGDSIPVHVTASPVYRDWKGRRRFNGAVLVLRDLRKLIEAEATERAGKAKDDFLASMSHELRTPLTAIIGNSDLLLDREEDEEKRLLLDSIYTASRNQLALINDILDMSKIESGKFTIDEVDFDLSELLHNIQNMLMARASDDGLSLEFIQETPHPYLLIGDPQRIGQILINLIGNALKFTVKGGVTVTSRVDQGYLLFRVEDTGIGMDAETVGRLFQRFEQADSSTSRRFGGSGLGLFISRNLAELMQGSIVAESEAGTGSVFTLSLPYRSSKTPVDGASDGSRDLSAIRQKFEGSVLVAEDTPELQLLERRTLELLGVQVTVANNGAEAVELAASHPFDLILMDMQMPVLDGIDATRQLRAQGVTTPVVALTANVMQKHRDAFYDAGCNGYLEKPFDKQALVKQLCNYLVAGSSMDIEISAPLNAYEKPMTTFVEGYEQYRMNLIVALSKKCWEEIDSIAYQVKGSGISYGYPDLSEQGGEICKMVESKQYDTIPPLVGKLVSDIGRALGK